MPAHDDRAWPAGGVSRSQIGSFESAVNRVPASRLTEIADVLKVPVAMLFDGSARRSLEPANAESDHSPNLTAYACSKLSMALPASAGVLRSCISSRKSQKCDAALALPQFTTTRVV